MLVVKLYKTAKIRLITVQQYARNDQGFIPTRVLAK